MADPLSRPTCSSQGLPSERWQRSAPFPPALLRVTPDAAARIHGHEPALRALASQLEDAVELAGFSVTDASLLAEVLHDEPSNDVILVLTIAGFERDEHRLDLWGKLSDMVSENDDPLILERFGLVVHSATP